MGLAQSVWHTYHVFWWTPWHCKHNLVSLPKCYRKLASLYKLTLWIGLAKIIGKPWYGEMTLGHWTEVMTTYKLFQIQWLPILHHTSQRKTCIIHHDEKKYIIHQDEKTWSNRSIIFLYTFIFFTILGIEEETVVKKESLGKDAGNNNIKHV